MDVGDLHPTQEANRGITERGHRARPIFGPNLGSIFVVGHVAHIVQSRFDTPMPSHERADTTGIGDVRSQIGDPEGNFISGMLSKEVGHMAVDAEDLAHMGPVQIVV